MSAGRLGGADKVLYDFFDDHARNDPDHPAVEVPGRDAQSRRMITYGELQRRSRDLAAALAARVDPDTAVAILLPRDIELYTAQLGAIRAGAAFVSIDPTFPDAHVRFVIADCGATVVLTDSAGANRVASIGVDSLMVIDTESWAEPCTATGSLPRPSPRDLAYMIYTSGTTGHPKGVMVEHRSIVNLVRSNLETFSIGSDDRVVQNSSAAYDSSIDETWLAFATGATLVVADDRTVRSGPDLIGWLRDERITVFCPPPTLLRTTGCANPQGALPDLRLLYVGGEALTADIVDRWSSPWRLENGYGPTECTIVATRATIRAGAPVTIGRPVAGNEAHVLDDDLGPVADGEIGELCISGLGVARGYRNLPELTAARFPDHPVFGRIYRTGDLVRRQSDGELEYLGRRDLQVKVRGHRIELEAVESALVSLPGVREAVCTVQGAPNPRLVGFVVPESRDEPPDLGALRMRLRAMLPPAMVPSRLGTIGQIPTTVGGKLDRARLPDIDEPSDHRADLDGLDDVGRHLARCFSEVLGTSVGADDQIFDAHGADSLAVAEVVSKLRDDPRTMSLTVRDVYEAPTVRELRSRCRARTDHDDVGGERATARLEAHPPVMHRWRLFTFTAIQSAWIIGELVLLGMALHLLAGELMPSLLSATGLTGSVLVVAVTIAVAPLALLPATILVAVLLKRLVLGRYTRTVAPYWGAFHMRHWIVTRAARRVPWSALAGTPLAAFTLRRLGARVGRDVHIGRGVDLSNGGWDLLEIGDGAVLARDAYAAPVEEHAGGLHVAPITIGRGAVVGLRAVVGPGSALGDDAILTDLSTLHRTVTGPSEVWDGVPATRAGDAPRDGACSETGSRLTAVARTARTVLLRVAVRVLVESPVVVMALAVFAVFDIGGAEISAWFTNPDVSRTTVTATVAFVVARLPITLVAEAVAVRMLAPRRTAVVPLTSFTWERAWTSIGLVDSASRWLSGTLLWVRWLRLAGMRIGRNTEVSTVIDLVPPLVTIGDECFLADGNYVGAPRLRHGRATLGRTALGDDTFVGNHAVVTVGATLPDDVLVGVSTVTGTAGVDGPGTWFGHPMFRMPRPVAAEFERSSTHDPPLLRRIDRWCWELGRLLLPALLTVLGFLWLDIAGDGSVESTIVASCVTATVAYATVAGGKWCLIGRVRPGRHPLWSNWCNRWDFLYMLWAVVGRAPLAQLEGTLLLNAALRGFGMRIGRGVVLGHRSSQIVDPDMLHFGEGAVVLGDFQAHSFEDRVLKIDHVHVRSHALVAPHAVLFYGCDVREATTVLAGSVVLKGERLSEARTYAGAPVREWTTPDVSNSG